MGVLAFTLILTAFIYPIVGAWHWGQGWLFEAGFVDFAGSTIVHTTGGWATLAGLLIIGPRLGKFRKDGSVKSTPPSNVLVVTLGVLILWLGLLDLALGLRVSAEAERLGQDTAELGIETYPEFVLMPEEFGDED